MSLPQHEPRILSLVGEHARRAAGGAHIEPAVGSPTRQTHPRADRPLRILHVVQGYAPAIGGTERVVQRLSEELVRQFGDDVTVFTTDSYSAEAFPRPSLPRMAPGWESRNGVRVRRFPVWRKPGALLNVVQGVAFRWNLPFNEHLRTWYGGPLIPLLAGAIRRFPADVVASSSFPLMHMYDALRGAHRAGRPCVFIGGLHPEDRWGFDRARIHRAIQKCDRYIAYTGYEAERVIARGASPERIETIALGVDPEPFLSVDAGEAKRALGLGTSRVVGFVGQLGVHKGVDTILEAMPAVWQRCPDVQLVIAGARTVFAAYVETRIAALPAELRQRVRLVEDFPEPQKPLLFGALDAFALPSAFESFGITYLEAWAAGKPVIGCRTGAVSCVVEHDRDGLLVPVRDPHGLAEALLRILENPGLGRAMGAAGRRKVLRDHTWPAVAARFRNAYLRAIAA
ncbi:MAG TPA: glycosyltransferase family 4 protein [Candidatus Binatia bacterium]|nr:glycosyltransferase family 4 protein [Candidatus Binatia bacterium]